MAKGGVVDVAQIAQCALHLPLANVLSFVAQVFDQRAHTHLPVGVLQTGHLFRNNRFHLWHFPFSGRQGLVQTAPQIVHIVEGDAGQFAHRGVDVPGHGQVHQQQRALRAQGNRVRHHLPGENGLGRARSRNDHIRLGKPLGQPVQGKGAAAKGRRRALGSGKGAVDHLHTARAPMAQGFEGQSPHLPRADDQHPPLAQLPRVLLGQRKSHGRDAGRVGADGGLVARPFARADGRPEKFGQAVAQAARFGRLHKGAGHLAQNLGFAQHQRIQPRRHPQQMGGRVPAPAAVEMARQLAFAHTRRLAEQRRHRLFHPVRPGRRTGVEFQPVTGGEQNHFAKGRADSQHLFQRTGQPLPHLHRRGAVIDAETKYRWNFHWMRL